MPDVAIFDKRRAAGLAAQPWHGVSAAGRAAMPGAEPGPRSLAR
ncbi:hypothetical protein SAMN05421759_11842 [Roseivivax lentus]|uniref:Uncharacterized protein n=1 Tax=Roseivivax lentus TaxID=633194 RepID=A0A1N7PPL2_9RHOB|nr:hypothetical protein SAMN05421759_11842 [Roseivivax lentus]